MSIENLKFKESEFEGKDISSLPDEPSNEGLTAQELKERFDYIAKNMIALGRFNELVDILASAVGGRNIGASDYKGRGFSDVQGGIESALDYVDEKILAIGAGDMSKAEFVNEGGIGVVLKALRAIDAEKFNNKTENELLSKIYPVGCIYMSAVATNPKTLFGIGTWVEWGKGRVPVGVDTAQVEFNTVEKTGGSKTHVLTVNEMPAHNHPISFNHSATAFGGYALAGSTEYGATATVDGFINNRGGGAAHNNLQPYITCYMWKRTA